VITATIERLKATQGLEGEIVVEDVYTNEFLPTN